MNFWDSALRTTLLKLNAARINAYSALWTSSPNLRSTLYVKDDDWRLSFIMGNYITLTNLTERDIQRIISRRVSPLYISVHTTDPELRRKMLNNPKAGELMPFWNALPGTA